MMLVELDVPDTLDLDSLLDGRGRLCLVIADGTTLRLRVQPLNSESIEDCVHRVTEGVNEAWRHTSLRGEHQQTVLARVLSDALARRLLG